jgi:hypothetical protein
MCNAWAQAVENGWIHLLGDVADRHIYSMSLYKLRFLKSLSRNVKCGFKIHGHALKSS